MSRTQEPVTQQERRTGGRFTIRNVGGVALFLLGTAFLWVTPGFATPGVDTSGVWWDVTQVLALATLAGFTVATGGLFARRRWWAPVALTAAALGLFALVPFWIAAQAAGETTPWWTALVLALGCGGVFLLLLVPRLRAWVDGHVQTGR